MSDKAKSYPPFSVRMSKDLHDQLNERMAISGRSKNAEIIYLLKQVIKGNEEQCER